MAPSVETPEREPLTMEDLLREMEEGSVKSLAYGDIVEGVVVRVDPDEVLVDIGAKSEGVISNRELSGRNEAAVILVSGERVKVYVLQPEDEEGRVILSLRKARAEFDLAGRGREGVRRARSSTPRFASRTRAA